MVTIKAPVVTHDCSLDEDGPHVFPWYQYHIERKVWEDTVEWEFIVLNLEVIFCPACGLNLEQAYQEELAQHV